MKFKIDNKIFEKFPNLNLGIVIVKGINNAGNNEDILNLINEKIQEIKVNFNMKTLSQNPKIVAWRNAYSLFGVKPKKYKCSVENLYRLILDGIELRHINKVVDVYNYISIKHMIPVGGDDIDKIDGNITLKFAQGDETFVELNSQEIKNPKEEEIIYLDDKEVLCRRWNWRECNKSKMTEETKNVALVVEGIPPILKEDIKKIINELSELVQRFCGGEIKTFILNNSNSEIEF